MAGTSRVCPNGHVATVPDQRFCETCGAGMAMPDGSPLPPAGVVPPPPSPVAPPAGWPPPEAGPPAAFAPAQPPARRGPSVAVVLGLIVLVALAGSAAAFVLIAKPFGGAAASPTPSAVAAATAAPSSSATATPGPTAATPQPTLEPSPQPTAALATPTQPSAEPSALPSGAPTASCRSETVGLTVAYPAGWHAYAGDARWTCLLFDPQPIEILADSELPPVAVAIFEESRPAATVAADFETATIYTVLDKDSGTVDGHPAVAYQLENTGQGYYEKGVLQTVFIVDLGSRGSLVLETTGTAGDRYDGNIDVLVRMVEALEID